MEEFYLQEVRADWILDWMEKKPQEYFACKVIAYQLNYWNDDHHLGLARGECLVSKEAFRTTDSKYKTIKKNLKEKGLVGFRPIPNPDGGESTVAFFLNSRLYRLDLESLNNWSKSDYRLATALATDLATAKDDETPCKSEVYEDQENTDDYRSSYRSDSELATNYKLNNTNVVSISTNTKTSETGTPVSNSIKTKTNVSSSASSSGNNSPDGEIPYLKLQSLFNQECNNLVTVENADQLTAKNKKVITDFWYHLKPENRTPEHIGPYFEKINNNDWFYTNDKKFNITYVLKPETYNRIMGK